MDTATSSDSDMDEYVGQGAGNKYRRTIRSEDSDDEDLDDDDDRDKGDNGAADRFHQRARAAPPTQKKVSTPTPTTAFDGLRSVTSFLSSSFSSSSSSSSSQSPSSATSTAATASVASAPLGHEDRLLKPPSILQSILSASEEDRSNIQLAVNEEDPRFLEKRDAPKGCCIECEDQPASLYCENCCDDYCEVCFESVHRKGNRSKHVSRPIEKKSDEAESATAAAGDSNADPASKNASTVNNDEQSNMDEDVFEKAAESYAKNGTLRAPITAEAEDSKHPVQRAAINETAALDTEEMSMEWFQSRARYIPMRLALEERKYLRLLEAALSVSEYTDKVDILSFSGHRSKRMVAQIKELCAILSGLLLASDYNAGQALLKDRSFGNNANFFASIFEIGRRHKIANPGRMRSTYGKLVYLLQDSLIPEVEDMLQFSCVKKVVTVGDYLEQRGAAGALIDPLIRPATMEIHPEGKTRRQINEEIKTKENAINTLARKYKSNAITSDEIMTCLYSIGDHHAYLRGNRDPVDAMIRYLLRYFRPDSYEDGLSLAISAGRHGARLTHDHERQFHYVHQSLTLWREIAHDMYRLWCLSEGDLLSSENPYRLLDTGQGLNRVQDSPKVYRAMHNILAKVQRKLGFWIGSSAIHLGDMNVPNALFFIDKYNQVPLILNPVVRALDDIERIVKDPDVANFVQATYGTVDQLRKTILSDFFRFAFDGSGADNYFSAGSCIDGRLTSAWNWCNQLEKKPYFNIFLLTGFNGFDGGF